MLVHWGLFALLIGWIFSLIAGSTVITNRVWLQRYCFIVTSIVLFTVLYIVDGFNLWLGLK